MSLQALLNVELLIIQAPMAGVRTNQDLMEKSAWPTLSFRKKSMAKS